MPRAFDQVVDAPRADTVDVRLLDDGYQRSFPASPRLEQRRVVATIAHTRHTQFDAADTRIPCPIAIAISFTGALGSAFVLLGAEMLGNFQFHQLLRHRAHTLAQEVDVLVHFGLAQQLEKRHPQVLGHRSVPSSR
jgi:hypothetical protein